MLRGCLSRLPIVLALLTLMPSHASADGLERGFDFDTFQRQEQQRQADGYVLENVYDRRGKVAGKFSLGGKSGHDDPFYNFDSTGNYRGSRGDEVGQGIVNFRVSF